MERWTNELAQRQPRCDRHRTLVHALEQMVFAQTRAKAELLRKRFRHQYWADYLGAVKWADEHWNGVCAHQLRAGLPLTNVAAENVNKQIMRRVKTIEVFRPYTRPPITFVCSCCISASSHTPIVVGIANFAPAKQRGNSATFASTIMIGSNMQWGPLTSRVGKCTLVLSVKQT